MRAVVWMLLALATGCGHSHDDEPHTVHDHEDEQGHHDHHHGGVESVTAWSDTLELFAEWDTPVAGQETSFLLHLTTLEDFRAVSDARVRLVLEGPETVSVEVDNARPGIFEPSLTAPSAGTYRGRVEVLRGEVVGAALSVGGFEVIVHAAAPDDDEHDEDEEGGITLLKEQQWRVPFRTAAVAQGSVAPTVETPGELTTPPGGAAHVHAPVAGRVAASRGAFPAPGRVVEANQELATLAPTPGAPEDATRAELAVVDAEAALENARAELARVERMRADDAIPERRLEEARRGVRVAEASLGAARRARSLYAAAERGRGRGSWRITSPITGVVDDVRVSPGEAVEANELLFHVLAPGERWLRAEVPERWAARIRPGGHVRFQLLGEEGWRDLDGDIVNVSSAVDARSRTVAVIWSLREPEDALRVGASIRVSIPIGDEAEGITVPERALIDVDGRPVVFVQREGERFEERPVRVVVRGGGRAVVEGLEAGERVVTVGAYLVHLASRAAEGGAPHGHVH